MTEEAGRITERARDESDAIIARAQEQAARMLEERELVAMAKQRAAEIIDTTTREAAEIRRGADEYAAGVLIRLEGECIRRSTHQAGHRHADERYGHLGRQRPTVPMSRESTSHWVPPSARDAAQRGGHAQGRPERPRGALRDRYLAVGSDVELAARSKKDRMQAPIEGICSAAPIRHCCGRPARARRPFVEPVRSSLPGVPADDRSLHGRSAATGAPDRRPSGSTRTTRSTSGRPA